MLGRLNRCSLFKRTFSSVAVSVERLQSLSPLTTAEIQGWVQRSQKRGQVNFLHINDGLSSSTVQVVVPREICHTVPVGSGVSVKGTWQESSGSHQSMELLANSCEVLSNDSDPRYASLTPDQLRKFLHIRARSPAFASLLRLRSRLLWKTHDFFMQREFVHIDTPILTANDCEGAGETFSIASCSDRSNFFRGDNTFLTVSGQLHLEAITSGISHVYTLNGGFRADKQQSSTHLTEFRMLEAEVAFMQDLNQLLDLVRDFLLHMAQSFLEDARCQADFNALGAFSSKDHIDTIRSVAACKEFPILTYEDAVNLLHKNGHDISENGFNKQNEAFLVKYCNSPVFVTHFPSVQKPFYMKRSANGLQTESFDLLCPIVGELAGGSIREESPDLIKKQGGTIEWYEECRRRGKPISGGFGLGFERMLQLLLGVKNIKDTIPFPRWFKHCQC